MTRKGYVALLLCQAVTLISLVVTFFRRRPKGNPFRCPKCRHQLAEAYGVCAHCLSHKEHPDREGVVLAMKYLKRAEQTTGQALFDASDGPLKDLIKRTHTSIHCAYNAIAIRLTEEEKRRVKGYDEEDSK